MDHARKFTVVLSVAALCAGCTTGFVYNRLDRAAYWYFSRQVTLTEEQASMLRADLAALLEWHRESELPRYATLLDELARDAAYPFGRERIDRTRREIEGLWREIVHRAALESAPWLAGLSDAQIEELLANLAQDDRELVDKYCKPDERTLAKRRERSVISGIEKWTGRLSQDQRTIVRATVAELEPLGCEWVANQRQFRSEFRRLLAGRADDPRFAATLARFLLNPEDRWTALYRERFLANRERMVRLVAEIDTTLSPRQRARLTGRLADLAHDLRNLSRVRSAARGELGDGHHVLGGIRRARLPDVPGEPVPAHSL